MLMKRMNKWRKKIQRTYEQRNREIMSMTLEPKRGGAEPWPCDPDSAEEKFERAKQPAKKEEVKQPPRTPCCENPTDWLEEEPTDWLDCRTWRLTPHEERKQKEIRKSMRSRVTREWVVKRLSCKRPITQTITTKWVKANRLGHAAIPDYDYHLEYTWEHIPCRYHIIQGIKPERIVELSPQETITELLRKEEKERREEKEEEKPMLSAGGASIVIIGTLGAQNPEKNEGWT